MMNTKKTDEKTVVSEYLKALFDGNAQYQFFFNLIYSEKENEEVSERARRNYKNK